MRGADQLVQALADAGVGRIYALSGNQIMPVFDACFGAGIEIIHVRHEAAAVYMAEANAQLTGSVGIALVTAGAGLANALAPLATARASDTPVLLISGDAPVLQDGTGAFQEIDQVSITSPLTKLSMRAESADVLAAACGHGLDVALSGRPGPVHLALPADVATAKVSDAHARDYPKRAQADCDPDQTARLCAMIAHAARPLIILGPALNPTRAPDLGGLSNSIDAPVVTMESPRGFRDPALGHLRALYEKADLVVTLGKQVDFSLDFGAGSNTNWAVALCDPADLERARQNLGQSLSLALCCDPLALARSLVENGGMSAARAVWRAEANEFLAKRTRNGPSTARITPWEVTQAVQAQIDTATDPVLICDGGEFGQWAQAGLTAPRRVINGLSGAIGGGLSYAIAARASCPGATVFALMGDGTVGFHLAEFETAARYGLPFVAVVGNDRRWNAEHQIQLRDYGPDRLVGCDLSDARYDLAVAALGGHGELVTAQDQLDGALTRAVASGLPALVNVQIDGRPAPEF